jgi:hypothetical protein
MGLVNLGIVQESETRRLEGFSREKRLNLPSQAAYENISRTPRYGI